MALFRVDCPVELREQRWIEQSMAWFYAEFGDEPLRRPVVLPTKEFFPGTYDGSISAIRAVIDRVCGYAQVDPGLIDVRCYGDSGEQDLANAVGLTVRSHSAAGHYQRVDGRAVIGIDQTLGSTPDRLVATAAHELSHVRLLDEGRISADRADHEPLTDLLTVFLGLGIFTANARLTYRRDDRRSSTSTLGYLTEPMFGYGLACYAWLRSEQHPRWVRYLDTNPRAYCQRGLRYLAAHAEPAALPHGTGPSER